jgi:hypothetical protein
MYVAAKKILKLTQLERIMVLTAKIVMNQNIICFCTQNYILVHLKICLFKIYIKLIFFNILILK